MKQALRVRKRSDSGFSLAEIAIALFVLALGLLAIVSLFPAAVEFSSNTQERTEVSNIARTAEAYLNYTGILRELDGGSMYGEWVSVPSVGSVYYYPSQTTTTAIGCEGTYSWHAEIRQGGHNGTMYTLPDRPDHLLYIQLRVYRNFGVKNTPVGAYDIFKVPTQ